MSYATTRRFADYAQQNVLEGNDAGDGECACKQGRSASTFWYGATVGVAVAVAYAFVFRK